MPHDDDLSPLIERERTLKASIKACDDAERRERLEDELDLVQGQIDLVRLERESARVDAGAARRLRKLIKPPGHDSGGITLEECAQRLGITRERVRQIEAAALCKLRLALEHEGLSWEDLRPSERGASVYDQPSPAPHADSAARKARRREARATARAPMRNA